MTAEERLARLEVVLGRALRWNRWLLLLMGLAVGACLVVGAFSGREAQAQAAQSEVRAKRFVLEDENGKVRAELKLNGTEPGLTFSDEKGKTRAALGVAAEGWGVSIYDGKEKRRASLCVDERGWPWLNLYDENGVLRADLAVAGGGSGLELLTEKGSVRVTLYLDKDGSSLSFIGDNLKSAARLGVSKEGSELTLGTNISLAVDKDGSKLDLFGDLVPGGRMGCALLHVLKEGPALTLCDNSGKDRAVLGIMTTQTPDGKTTTYPESSLLLFGPDGKVLWQAP